MKILVLRAEEDSAHIKANLISKGFIPTFEPIFEFQADIEVKNQFITNITKYNVIIFSSINAIKILSDITFNNQIIITTGKSTASFAENFGFKNVINTGGNAESVINYIRNNLNKERYKIAYLSTEIVAKEIDKILTSDGFDIEKYNIYKVKEIEYLSKNIIDNEFAHVIILSKRIAEHFIYLCKQANIKNKFSKANFYVLSEEIANPLRKEFSNIFVSSKPDIEFLLEQIRS